MATGTEWRSGLTTGERRMSECCVAVPVRVTARPGSRRSGAATGWPGGVCGRRGFRWWRGRRRGFGAGADRRPHLCVLDERPGHEPRGDWIRPDAHPLSLHLGCLQIMWRERPGSKPSKALALAAARRGWMDLEEACSGFLAFRNHLSNLGLLLREELGRRPPTRSS